MILVLVHFQPVQEILPTDLPQRVRICEWWSNYLDTFSRTFFLDEATFRRGGINHFQNKNMWAIKNPQAVRKTRFQKNSPETFGPPFFDSNVNSEMYQAFLENDLPLLFKDIPLFI